MTTRDHQNCVLTRCTGISQLGLQSFSNVPRRLKDLQDFDDASRGAWGSFIFLLFKPVKDKYDQNIKIRQQPFRFLISLIRLKAQYVSSSDIYDIR